MTGAQTHNYAYDAVGNRITADGTSYVKNTLNQYTQVGPTSLIYTTNGNLANDGPNGYTYDEENRLIGVTKGTTNASYTYDAFNRRVSKTVNGVTKYFVYDGDDIIAEYDSAGVLLSEYVHGSGIDEVLTMTRNGATYYYHHDGLGSVTEITDGTGAVVENYTYDVYGQPSVTNSLIGNPYRFTGREYDEESGIYHYRARAYSPTLGRFLQRDPIGYYDSMNLYQYVGNNPVNWVDPYGLFGQLIIGWSVEIFIVLVFLGYICGAPQYTNKVIEIYRPIYKNDDGGGNNNGGGNKEKEKNLPQLGGHPYVPPKSKNKGLPKDKEGGYVDENGNSWQWDPRKKEWDVQHPNGSHTNVGPDGNVTHGRDNF